MSVKGYVAQLLANAHPLDAREEMEALGLKKIVLPETQQGAPLFENHKNN